MICTSCGENEAAIFIQELVDNQVRQASLCSSCADKAGAAAGAAEAFLLPLLAAIPKLSRGENAPYCHACGISYSEFRKTGFLGCPECYEAFKPALQRLLARIHDGATAHRGKSPS